MPFGFSENFDLLMILVLVTHHVGQVVQVYTSYMCCSVVYTHTAELYAC